MAAVRQTNFTGGELSPLLWGRTDSPLHAKGLRTCRNFFVSQQGAAHSRPGTTFVAGVKAIAAYGYPADPVNGPPRPVRPVSFISGDGSAFVLEFGEKYIRFHALGATVVDGGGNPVEVATPYLARDLWKLRFAQVGDVLTIVGEDYAPAELSRAVLGWSLTDIAFGRPETLYADVDDITKKTSPFAVVAASSAGSPPVLVLHKEAEDAAHPAREWQWLVTSIIKDAATGATYETLGDLVQEWWTGVVSEPELADDFDLAVQQIPDDKWVLYPDKKVALKRAKTATPMTAPTSEIIAYNLYRGRGGVFGWVMSTTSREFVDVGDEPDYTKQPPRGTNPFHIPVPAFGFAVMRPYSVAFFQERRWFGGAGVGGPNTWKQPGVLFASAVGDYFDHDLRLVKHVATEALLFEIASRQHERIQHLLDRDKLLAFTGASVWTVDGGQGNPVAFNSIDIRRVDQVGCGDVPPLVVDACPLFIRKKGFGARALLALGQDAGYSGFDISAQAEHLFVGGNRNVVDWCFQEDPWGVVWAVRADGQLLSLTFSRERQVTAWARHDMKYYDEAHEQVDEAFVEGICSIPEGEEDAVYLVVRRVVNGNTLRFIERMTSRVPRVRSTDPDPRYVAGPTAADTNTLYPTGVCVDCAITYAGPPTTEFNDLAPIYGKKAFLLARGLPPIGPFLVQNLPIDLGPDGLGLLEGDPAPNAVDDAGVPIFVCHIGQAFTAELETLDVAAGDARLRKKTVAQLGFEVDNSIGVKAGQDFDNLNDFQVREVGDDYNPVSPATALIDTPVQSAWDQSARAVLRQSMPVPLTVVGITRDIDVGG